MDDCKIVRERLGEFLVGALDGETSPAVERHLEGCAGCSEELAALQRLEGALFGIEPKRERVRAIRRRWAAAAAAALVACAGLFVWLLRPDEPILVSGRLSGSARLYTPATALPYREALASEEASKLELPHGRAVAVAARTLFELLSDAQVRLDDGEASFQVEEGKGTFEVGTPLGAVRVLGTSFLVQVRREDPMAKGTVVKSSAATLVVVAVVTGAVLWVNRDGSTERLDAGKQLTARPSAVEVSEFGPNVVRKLQADIESLRKERDGLAKAKDELAAKVSSLDEELKTFREKEEAQAKAEDDAKGRPLAFDKWQDVPELAEANWKEMGQAADNLSALLKEATEGGKPLAEMSKDLAVKVFTENSKLAALAVKLIGKLPTTVESGNGEYTHPAVNWNILAERLDLAGQSLSENQRSRAAQLGNEYDARWEQIQGGYTDQTSKLEKLVDELDLKKTYQDRLEALFTRDQREAVIDPETHHVSAIDLHSPMLMLQMVARPVTADSREGLRAAVLKGWADHFKIDAGQIEGHAGLLDAWLAEVEPRLSPVPKERAGLFNIEDALAAGRAQARLLRELMNNPAVSEEAKARILNSPGFLVPRLVEKK